jgi:hypothetical protein
MNKLNDESGKHTAIVRRVGWILMFLFAINVLIFVLNLLWKPNHFMLPIQALMLFGVASLLLQNSIRAIVFVRWMGVFLGTAALFAVFLGMLLNPWGLTKAQWVLNTVSNQAQIYETLFKVVLLLWISRELSHRSVMETLSIDRKLSLDLRLALASGIIAVGLFFAILHLALLNPNNKTKAQELALSQLPDGYQVSVSGITRHMGKDGTSFSAVVWAWTDNDLRKIQVQWAKQE